jgi:hypothetical protein
MSEMRWLQPVVQRWQLESNRVRPLSSAVASEHLLDRARARVVTARLTAPSGRPVSFSALPERGGEQAFLVVSQPLWHPGLDRAC